MMRFKWIISRCAEMTMLDENGRCHLAEEQSARDRRTFAGYEGLVIKEGRRLQLIVECSTCSSCQKPKSPHLPHRPRLTPPHRSGAKRHARITEHKTSKAPCGSSLL
ncbi:hypothetical protein [Muribaculum gordoncarteri]|uniref:hypothetical protein n=1 Tax=Muribaculum gordoncarteri TaxID=2530390 RepID=UPI003F678357